MTDASITTVIPTFRRPALLKRAIESVLAQSYRDLKVCVYDNASGDETEGVVRNIAARDARVFYHRHSENIGAHANFTQGLLAVTTPYYSLLGDDDFLLPDFYEKAMNAIKEHPDAGFVCSGTVVIDLIDKKLQFRNQDWQSGFYRPSAEIMSKMYTSHFVTTGVLLSTRVRDALGVFEPSGSDSLYMTMAAASMPFVVLEGYGAAVTLHAGAYSIAGEGIAKEGAPTLYKHLLASVATVIGADMTEEAKAHLLLYTIKSYQQSFDIKRLNRLMGKSTETEDGNLALLPSPVTVRSLLIRYYGLFPHRLYAFLSRHLNLLGYMKRMKHRMLGSSWVKLPQDACTLLDGQNSDVSKLMPYLKRDR